MMGSKEKVLPNYTNADYCKWEGKWEIIDGIPFSQLPGPDIIHQAIATGLGGIFYKALKHTRNKKFKGSLPIDFMITENTVIQPDFLIYSGEPSKPYLDFTPNLVAEILSPATAMKDRHTKFNLYEKAGVKWYLLVNPESEIVQVFVIENGEYKLKEEGHAFTYSFELEVDCRIGVDFGEIW